MGDESNQNIGQDYFAGAGIPQTSSRNEQSILANDIHAHVITTQALLQLRARFPTLCYDEDHAVVICDRDLQDMPIIYASPTFKNLTGYEPSEVLGINCRFLQCPNDLTPGHVVGLLPNYNGFDPNQPILKKKVERGETAYITIINYHKDGHAFLNGLSITPVTLDRSHYYVGFATDMSRQVDISKQTIDPECSNPSQRISDTFMTSTSSNPSDIDRLSDRPRSGFASDNLLPQTLDTLPSNDFEQALSIPPAFSNETEILISMMSAIPGYVVFVITPSGRILFLSKNAESLLGHTSDHLYMCSFLDIVHSQDLSALQAKLRKLAPGCSCEHICRMSTAYGTVVYMELCFSRVLTTSRPISYIVLSGKKISAVAISEQHIGIETADQRSVLCAKLSLSGLILHGTSALRSLFHTPLPLQQPSEGIEVIGLTFQSRLCQRSRKVFEDALLTMSEGFTESVTIQHCFQRPDGKKLSMTSNMLLAEDNWEGTAKSRPSFILIRLHYSRKDRNSASRSNGRRQSTHTLELTSALTCDHSCIANPSWQPHLSLATSASELQHQPHHWPGHSILIDSAPSLQRQIQHQRESDSDMFGFDPPPTPKPPTTLISLLPQDRDFCWQYTVHSLAAANQDLREELHAVLASLRNQRRRKRAKTRGQTCIVCGTSDTPEWRKGPSGNQDLCNRCGLRYAKTKSKQAQPLLEADVLQQEDESEGTTAE